jgi:5S rRNA maturation endonuclease (ribonuclease M5)
MNMPDSEINKLVLESLKEKEKLPVIKTIKTYDLKEEQLPNDCRSFVEWANEGCIDQNFVNCVDYVLSRGLEIDDYNWQWSSANGYKDRVIIPFYNNGKIVGWTGRKITDGKIKYLSKTQPGYLFNIDAQTPNKKFVIVVEGQFDAISIGGVATMQNEVSDGQTVRINALNREVIVVPDRDAAGAKMIQVALNNGWNVSIPPWDENIKDVNDAVKHYGKIYTLASILHYKETNKVKIEIAKKKLEKKLDSQN